VANRRIRLLALLFAGIFAVALVRATWLQGVRAPALDELALSQQRQSVTLPARRGTIYDRMGVELALGEEATTVYANPKEIRNAARMAELVAEDLDLDPAQVLAALSDRTKGFVYLVRQADPEQVAVLKQRGVTGIGFYPEQRRVYPQRKVAASVVGFAGVDNRGLAGLELQYDRKLTGTNGTETIVRDPFGRVLDAVDTRPVREGKELVLTVDHRLQAQVEAVLRTTRATWAAKSATAIVLDPATGGILALAQAPGFDANTYASLPPDRVRLRAVTDTY
jgi:cell division protein FtsI (penicillin-binding protein 3)